MLTTGHITVTYLGVQLFGGDRRDWIPLYIFANLPDIDFGIPFLKHRGPTHSIFAILIFPVLSHLKYTRPHKLSNRTLAYSLIYSGHIFLDMLFTGLSGGVQLLWAWNNRWYHFNLNIPFFSPKQIILEIIIAGVALLIWKYERRESE